MFKVKGVYNGTTVDLLEPVSIPVNTAVEISFDADTVNPGRLEALHLLHEKLVLQGVMSHVPTPFNDPFDGSDVEEPYHLEGESASEWIIRNRR